MQYIGKGLYILQENKLPALSTLKTRICTETNNCIKLTYSCYGSPDIFPSK